MSRCLELSFVEECEGGGLNFWSVDHSGDYREQMRRGNLMALEALELMARDDEGAPGELLSEFLVFGGFGGAQTTREIHIRLSDGVLGALADFLGPFEEVTA